MAQRPNPRIDRFAQMSKQEEIIAKKRQEILEKQRTAQLAKAVAAAQTLAAKMKADSSDTVANTDGKGKESSIDSKTETAANATSIETTDTPKETQTPTAEKSEPLLKAKKDETPDISAAKSLNSFTGKTGKISFGIKRLQPQVPVSEQPPAKVVNTFCNDGSFLENFKKILEKHEPKKPPQAAPDVNADATSTEQADTQPGGTDATTADTDMQLTENPGAIEQTTMASLQQQAPPQPGMPPTQAPQVQMQHQQQYHQQQHHQNQHPHRQHQHPQHLSHQHQQSLPPPPPQHMHTMPSSHQPQLHQQHPSLQPQPQQTSMQHQPPPPPPQASLLQPTQPQYIYNHPHQPPPVPPPHHMAAAFFAAPPPPPPPQMPMTLTLGPLYMIPAPEPLQLNTIPAPKEFNLNAIPKPQMNVEAIQMPHGVQQSTNPQTMPQTQQQQQQQQPQQQQQQPQQQQQQPQQQQQLPQQQQHQQQQQLQQQQQQHLQQEQQQQKPQQDQQQQKLRQQNEHQQLQKQLEEQKQLLQQKQQLQQEQQRLQKQHKKQQQKQQVEQEKQQKLQLHQEQQRQQKQLQQQQQPQQEKQQAQSSLSACITPPPPPPQLPPQMQQQLKSQIPSSQFQHKQQFLLHQQQQQQARQQPHLHHSQPPPLYKQQQQLQAVENQSISAQESVFSDKNDHNCSRVQLPTSVEHLIDLVAENGDDYEDKIRAYKNDLHPAMWFLFERNCDQYHNYRKQLNEQCHIRLQQQQQQKVQYEQQTQKSQKSSSTPPHQSQKQKLPQSLSRSENYDSIEMDEDSSDSGGPKEYQQEKRYMYHQQQRQQQQEQLRREQPSPQQSTSQNEIADKYDPESVISGDVDSDDEYMRGMLDRNRDNLKRRIECRNELSEEERQEREAEAELEEQRRLERKKQRKSRWGEKVLPSTSGAGGAPTALANVPTSFGNQNKPMLTAITRTDPALLQYARLNYGSTNLSEDDWKKCEEHYKVNLLYQDMMRKRQEIDRLARNGKFKYEYDSDEDVDGGTWEHKLRCAEMEATKLWATALTKQSEGKHHIGDFLPPEELKKFMEKYDAQKNNRQPDLSDYKEYKLKEDNIGFQMLQKLGWKEGQGLGQDGAGIVDPVNKAPQRDGNQGLGVASASVPEDNDNEYDAYRKRMMLAYRFRPNPLNNPRRAYY